MTDPDTETQSADANEWALIAVVLLAVFTIAAAHAPGSIRLIGLFGVAFGLLAGYGLGRLAAALGLKYRWTLAAFTALLLAAAGCGVVWESWRLYSADLWKVYGQRPEHDESTAVPGGGGLTGARFLGSAQKAIRQARLEKYEQKTRLGAYLQWRMSNSPLRDVSESGAVALTCVEWLCGAIAGAWLFAGTLKPPRAIEAVEPPPRNETPDALQ